MLKIQRSFPFFAISLILLAGQARPAHAEWQYTGSMIAEPPQGCSVTFRNSQAIVTVTVLASDVLRVRMTHGASFGPDYSYAVVKTGWPSPEVEFAGTKQTKTIRTADLEARVQLSPFRISFYDRTGQPDH